MLLLVHFDATGRFLAGASGTAFGITTKFSWSMNVCARVEIAVTHIKPTTKKNLPHPSKICFAYLLMLLFISGSTGAANVSRLSPRLMMLLHCLESFRDILRKSLQCAQADKGKE